MFTRGYARSQTSPRRHWAVFWRLGSSWWNSLLLLVTASSDQNRVSRYEQMHKWLLQGELYIIYIYIIIYGIPSIPSSNCIGGTKKRGRPISVALKWPFGDDSSCNDLSLLHFLAYGSSIVSINKYLFSSFCVIPAMQLFSVPFGTIESPCFMVIFVSDPMENHHDISILVGEISMKSSKHLQVKPRSPSTRKRSRSWDGTTWEVGYGYVYDNFMGIRLDIMVNITHRIK